MAGSRHAIIVGGGIGGLAAAIGLRRAGWRATVVERGTGSTEIGAGISLLGNALRAMDALGLDEALRDMPRTYGSGSVRTATGARLGHSSEPDADHAPALEMVLLHRAELHALLRAALPPEWLMSGVEVTAVDQPIDGEVRVHARGMAIERADLLVAADGVASRIRAQLWPRHPGAVYSGSTAWRAVLNWAHELAAGLSLGPGSEFGIMPLGDGRVYWFGSCLAPGGQRSADERAAAHARFGDWHTPIGELIAGTPADAVLRHDLLYLKDPLPSFVSGRVLLLGDAAHAMTPQLGQGGSQALEDAVELAAALATLPSVPAALERYDRRRRPRAQSIARASRRFSRSIQLRNPLAVAARNALLRGVPTGAVIRRSARLLDWAPPPITARAD